MNKQEVEVQIYATYRDAFPGHTCDVVIPVGENYIRVYINHPTNIFLELYNSDELKDELTIEMTEFDMAKFAEAVDSLTS